MHFKSLYSYLYYSLLMMIFLSIPPGTTCRSTSVVVDTLVIVDTSVVVDTSFVVDGSSAMNSLEDLICEYISSIGSSKIQYLPLGREKLTDVSDLTVSTVKLFLPFCCNSIT